jgi:hypothetical protein
MVTGFHRQDPAAGDECLDVWIPTKNTKAQTTGGTVTIQRGSRVLREADSIVQEFIRFRVEADGLESGCTETNSAGASSEFSAYAIGRGC